MTYLTISVLVAFAGAVLFACSASPAIMSYEEYLSYVQQQQQRGEEEDELQRVKRAQRDHCSLFPYNWTRTNDDGCEGHLPLFGCAGKCLSTETPKSYTSRLASSRVSYSPTASFPS